MLLNTMQAELTLTRQLRKTFELIKKTLSTWDQITSQCLPCVENISNQAEQLECCQRVKLAASPLKEFEDIRERLVGKLILSLEEEILKLVAFISQLKVISTKLSKENEKCFSIYHRQKKNLPLCIMATGTPLRPSYASMLEMTQDIDKACHNLYAIRCYHLDQLDYNKPASVQEAMAKWKVADNLQEQMEEKLSLVQFFLDSDFSDNVEAIDVAIS